MRVPSTAPATKPTRDSAPTMKPEREPWNAMSTAKATMIQSIAVTASRLRGSLLAELSARRRARKGMPRRVQALVAAGAVAFGVGLVCGATHQSTPEKNAKAFAQAWSRGDLSGMYRRLSADARKRFSEATFRNAYATDAMTATA